MTFRLSRLRAGEWLIGAASLALLVILFVVPWFGLPSGYAHAAASLGAASSFSGWESLSILRWLIVLLGLGGFLAWYLQGRCLAAALPVCAVVLETALSVVVVVGLYYRVIIAGPVVPVAHDDPAAFVGLALAVAVLVGGYLSLRQDQAPARGAVVELERRRVSSPRGAG
ncbi:MAG TPA: hypothetical protein VG405_00865 [Solirubrobacteraceae bacterium]|jgi:hypothetical protein|nr:hypothetical protein [Solirubrobacteraceae bacterium]